MNVDKFRIRVAKHWATICLAIGLAACAAGEPIEYLYLDSVADPKRWEPAECEVTLSPHQVWNRPTLTMRIPIDYSSGEKKHPIGWPRMYLNLQPQEQVWAGYDRLEFQIYSEFNREKLPKRPLIFHLYAGQGQQNLTTLDRATIGEWQTVRVNLYDLKMSNTITRLGFNINEADYQDQDLVVFHLGGFRLARATAATLTELNAIAPAIFCDSQVLPLEIVMEGPLAKLAAGIPVRLTGKDGKVFQSNVVVSRGLQIVNLPLGGAALVPGLCSVTVFPDDAQRQKTVEILVASSPWR